MKRSWRRLPPAMAVVTLLGVLCDRPAQATPDEQCDVQLTVELTPDVPDARDDGFLSSLLDSHTAYRLLLLREDDASVIELELSGPGPDYRCDDVIETIRKDGRVLSIRVDSSAALNTAGASGPLSSADSSAAHPSELGLGALYWAVHHPRQAWRILLPIQSRDAAPDAT